jgi:hypothetical protein
MVSGGRGCWIGRGDISAFLNPVVLARPRSHLVAEQSVDELHRLAETGDALRRLPPRDAGGGVIAWLHASTKSELQATARDVIDSHRGFRHDCGVPVDQRVDERPNPDARRVQCHGRQDARRLEHDHAPMIGLIQVVAVPQHIEPELLGPLPPLRKLREWPVGVLVGTEPDPFHWNALSAAWTSCRWHIVAPAPSRVSSGNCRAITAVLSASRNITQHRVDERVLNGHLCVWARQKDAPPSDYPIVTGSRTACSQLLASRALADVYGRCCRASMRRRAPAAARRACNPRPATA